MKAGEIYLVEIPVSGGHEQAGTRPAIIIQDTLYDQLPTVLIIPLTSKQKAANFPFTFVIKPDESNNLDMVSVALIFQLRAIDRKRLKDRIGEIKAEHLKLLRKAVKKIMGLPNDAVEESRVKPDPQD